LKYLAGLITATGLKPNFAYQIKLIGNPSKAATTDAERAAADDATNEALGRLGRWWRSTPSAGNANDADYDAHKNDPAYIYEGYLLIAFFVTDSAGNASVRFEGNNSFHVLWRVDQRPRSSADGPALPVTVPATSGNSAYDAAVGERSYSLYGEWEPTRAAPGALQMANGHYRCRLVLTEESFHDFGTNAGNWNAALSAPMEFDIPFALSNSGPVEPPVTPPDSALPLSVEALRVTVNPGKTLRDRGVISGSLKLPAGFAVENLEVQTTVLGTPQSFVLDKRGRDVIGQGSFELRPPRKDQTDATFKLRSRRMTYSLPAADAPLTVTVKLGADTYFQSLLPVRKTRPHSVLFSYKQP